MITNLHIQNFKSIKDLKLDCSRVNIFIGEPNTGKSNILESVGILSLGYAKRIENIVRFEETTNLFWDEDFSNPINILYKISQESAQYPNLPDHMLIQNLSILYNDGKFNFRSKGELKNCDFTAYYYKTSWAGVSYSDEPIVKFYNFKHYKTFPETKIDFLLPPNGRNLISIILTNPEIKSYISDLLRKYGYKLSIDKEKSKISIAKDNDLILITHPYSNLADTLQRMIFYNAAIESNKNSILVFDEPDVYTFPFYTEQLALSIAYNSNQFFIATHNPYLLNMLINKTKTEELSVFKVMFKDYQTFAKPIEKSVLQNFVINDYDILLNIDRLGED